MSKKKLKTRPGFTLAELAVTTVIAGIVISGIGIILVDSQRGWNKMYSRIYSDVVTDSYVARRAFDSVIRKASGEKFLLSEDGDWVEVCYYADSGSTAVDRYARFYYIEEVDGVETGRLNVEYGKLNPRETLTIQTVCENVTSCVFKGTGRSAQMILTLDDGSQTVAVTSSALMHNQ